MSQQGASVLSFVPREEGFIASHAGAAASRQNKRSMLHVKIVTVPGSNIIGWLAFALLALAPLQAEPAVSARKLVIRADKRTGRLVTVSVATAKPAGKTASANIAQIVEDAAKANGMDPLLVHSVIQVESNYNPKAVSSAGARGLMQLMPGTARQLGVTDSFDPRQNIEAGVKYLKQLKDQYQDDNLALAAYNAGPGSVQKYKSVPPYPETRDYVQRVGERYVEARKAAGIAPVVALPPAVPQELPQAPVVDVPTEEKHARLEQFLDEYGRLHLRTVPE
jgi:soluble lytic murein transglycosylase-like protein